MVKEKIAEAKQANEEELEMRPLVANADNSNVSKNQVASDANISVKENKIEAEKAVE